MLSDISGWWQILHSAIGILMRILRTSEQCVPMRTVLLPLIIYRHSARMMEPVIQLVTTFNIMWPQFLLPPHYSSVGTGNRWPSEAAHRSSRGLVSIQRVHTKAHHMNPAWLKRRQSLKRRVPAPQRYSWSPDETSFYNKFWNISEHLTWLSQSHFIYNALDGKRFSTIRHLGLPRQWLAVSTWSPNGSSIIYR